MGKLTKEQKAVILSVIIIGAVPFGFGAFEVGSASFETHERQINPVNMSKTLLVPYYAHFGYNLGGGDIGSGSANFNFTTLDVYAVDNWINWSIRVNVSSPYSVEHIYFVTTTPNVKLPPLSPYNMTNFIDRERHAGHLIELNNDPTYTNFTSTGRWKNPIEQQISLIGIVNAGQAYNTIEPTQPLFTIDSSLAKIQADTDINIQKQIQESKTTNDITTGLTWILIGLVPVGIAMDILIRNHLDLK